MSGSSEGGWSKMRISNENLHISAFVLVKPDPNSVLLLKATDAHPLSFRRGKLMLPATILQFGENPADAAQRAVSAQLSGMEGVGHKFVDFQSFMGSHWDIVTVFEFDPSATAKIVAKSPYADAAFYKLNALPRASMAEDHLEVIDGLSAPE